MTTSFYTVPDFGPSDLLTSEAPGLRSVKVALADFAGRVAHNTIFGEVTTGQRRDDISVQFLYGASSRDLKIDLSSNGGTVTHSGSRLLVNAPTVGAIGKAQSIDAVRYRPGHECVAMWTSAYTDMSGADSAFHGLANTEARIGFGRDPVSGAFGAKFRSNSIDYFIPQTQFNLDRVDGNGASGHVHDWEGLRIYSCTYGYLGVAPIVLSVYGGFLRGWVPVHVICPTSDLGLPDGLSWADLGPQVHLTAPVLPIVMEVTRGDATGNAPAIHSGSWRAGVVGEASEDNSSDRWFSVKYSRANLPSVNLNQNPNQYTNLFTLRSKDLFQGRANHVKSQLVIVTFFTDGNKSVEFEGLVNASVTPDTAYADVDGLNSVNEVAYGGTATGQSQGATTVLGKVDRTRDPVEGTGIIWRGGGTLTLAARGIGGAGFTGDVGAVFRFKEEF